MAISGIQVVGPRSQQQAQPEESAIDKILKGLQIAGGISGLAVDVQEFKTMSQQQDLNKLEQARINRIESGIQTEPEALASGAIPATGAPGEQTAELSIQGADGKVERRAYIAPGQRQESQFSRELAQNKENAANALKAQKMKVNDDIARGKIDSANKLRDEWKNKSKTTLATQEMIPKLETIRSALALRNGTADLAGINKFQRMLDDGVVRGEDIAMQSKTVGLLDQAQLWAKNAKEGDLLPDGIRERMLEVSEGLMANQLKSQFSEDQYYMDLATRQGYNPGDVVQDLGHFSLYKKYGIGQNQINDSNSAKIGGFADSLKNQQQQAPRQLAQPININPQESPDDFLKQFLGK